MKETKKKLKKELREKGITLLALVITIVIIIILATATINLIFGSDGLIARAIEAKQLTEEATDEEKRKLTQLEAAVNLENQDYYDSDGNKAVIPAGFAVSQVDGEREIDTGLVIIDSEGNEYVWIPCTEEEYSAADSSWQRNDTYEEREWTDTQSTEIGLKSIQNYGGFYIARYEAGIPETATEIYASTAEGEFGSKRLQRNSSTVVEKYTPISQQGQQVWSTVSHQNAKILAEKMKSNDFVQSYLVDAYAWNAVCRVIEKNTDKSITDSTIWGNYWNNKTTDYSSIYTTYGIYYNIPDPDAGTAITVPSTINIGRVSVLPVEGDIALELASGASEDFKAYNIYDLAGNMWEWTTEESADDKAAIRGGSFSGSGAQRPIVMMNGDNSASGYYSYNISFRSVLYLK